MIASLVASALALTGRFTQTPPDAVFAKGTSLTDQAGRPVRLQGVNFGGWLVEEIWMTPWINRAHDSSSETIQDHESLWATIEKRLGRASMLRVRKAWRDTWITRFDFEKVKSLGLNHVRIPFLWHLADEQDGLSRLDWAVAEAARQGLYVVLDMHGTPGHQSGEHHTGKTGVNRLWFDVENISKMESVWAKVARRYKSNPTVVAFDIMNEPMGAPNPAMLHLVYDRVIRAIRKVAPQKVVIVDDGYKGFETTPHPNVAQWSDVMFSLHFYNFDAKQPADHTNGLNEKIPKLKELQGYRSAPLYIGEFQLEPHFEAGALRSYLEAMDRAGWNWCLWTWKAFGAKGDVGQWGVYRPKGAWIPLDPFRDSEAELIDKMKQFTTDRLAAPGEYLDALRQNERVAPRMQMGPVTFFRFTGPGSDFAWER